MYVAAGIGESPALLAVITGLFGIFGGGTVVALLRINVDKHKIVVEAAQGAVIVQTGVIDNLNNELTRVREDLDEVETRARNCEKETQKLRRENRELRHRVEVLEQHDQAVGGTGS